MVTRYWHIAGLGVLFTKEIDDGDILISIADPDFKYFERRLPDVGT